MNKYAITRNEPHRVIEEGHYTVAFDNFNLDFFFRPSALRRAIIMLPGFIDRARVQQPYFQRMKWLQEIDGAAFILTDPTLDLSNNVQIGWFVGNRESYFVEEIGRFIWSVLDNLKISLECTLFFGSSAGGHASIAFATHLKGSIALAVNPQTDALRLHNAGELAAFLRAAYGSSDLPSAETNWGSRLKLTELMKNVGHVPPMYIWQNFYDTYHYHNHLLPFLEELKTLKPSHPIAIHIGTNIGSGHDPAGLDELRPFFDRIFQSMQASSS